jgi:small subunit ribosomal protein S1
MSEKESSVHQVQMQEYLADMQKIDEGSPLEGIIVHIDREFAYLDVGLKSEGRIPLNEFDEAPVVGAKVVCILLRKENRDGSIMLSKRRADQKSTVKFLEDAFKDRTSIAGTIVKIIKSGFTVDIGSGLTAFLPASKADIHHVEDNNELIGVKSYFFIERLMDKGRLNVVVNRRTYLLETAEKAREEFFTNTHVGDEVEGVVKSFTSFGAFIDLGGFDGLLHLNDMSWGHASRPKDYVQKDSKIKLKVIRLDSNEKRINLSLKHFAEDPWANFAEKYHVDQIVEGSVTKLSDFGAFVELEEGVEGLVHISEMSWLSRVKHPKELLNIGDKVKVCILGYDTELERLSLGLKQTLENPWQRLEQEYPVGAKITRKIHKVTQAGIFVQLEEGMDGFLPIEDVSWGKDGRQVATKLQAGEDIDVVVTESDANRQRIRLGLKQLSEDPWSHLRAIQKRGEAIEGEVVNKTAFGVFVKLPDGLEGLIHKNNLSDTKSDDVEALLAAINLGDKITSTIIELSPEKQRISLSVRDYKIKQQQEELSQYIDNDNEESNGYTLGDILKKNSQ